MTSNAGLKKIEIEDLFPRLLSFSDKQDFLKLNDIQVHLRHEVKYEMYGLSYISQFKYETMIFIKHAHSRNSKNLRHKMAKKILQITYISHAYLLDISITEI